MSIAFTVIRSLQLLRRFNTLCPAGERPLEESKQYCAFLLESALAAMPPGTETILGIFDLRGFGHRNADLGFVRFLVRSVVP